MALIFPLALADFYDRLPISRCSFHLPPGTAHSQTRGGEVLSARVANRLWRGKVELGSVNDRRAAGILSKLAALGEPQATFFAYPFDTPSPASDALGTALAARTVTISALPANRFEMRLAGLPAHFILMEGDALSFTYGTNPVRQAFHRLTQDVQADASGVTPVFSVTPSILAGAAVGATVKLIRPTIKAMMLPNSLQAGMSDTDHRTSGISFEFIQTLG